MHEKPTLAAMLAWVMRKKLNNPDSPGKLPLKMAVIIVVVIMYSHPDDPYLIPSETYTVYRKH